MEITISDTPAEIAEQLEEAAEVIADATATAEATEEDEDEDLEWLLAHLQSLEEKSATILAAQIALSELLTTFPTTLQEILLPLLNQTQEIAERLTTLESRLAPISTIPQETTEESRQAEETPAEASPDLVSPESAGEDARREAAAEPSPESKRHKRKAI